MSNLVHTYESEYTDETLTAQNEFSILMRRSSMYEFIFLFIIALIVLIITMRNLASDTTTTAAYVVSCIILFIFFIVIIMYVMRWIGAISYPSRTRHSSRAGPIIRIHYV